MTDKELLEMALEWYQSYDDTKKECALQIFPKEKLESELKRYNNNKKTAKQLAREADLKKKLERCKKLFPVGTLIWSNEGTDLLPNLVINEPYIADTRYDAPSNVYEWNEKDRKTIYVNTLRLHVDDNGEWSPCSSKEHRASLEICLENMDKTRFGKNHIIDLKQFYKEQDDWLEKQIERVEGDIDYYSSGLADAKEDLAYYKKYDPRKLNAERIKEILKNV